MISENVLYVSIPAFHPHHFLMKMTVKMCSLNLWATGQNSWRWVSLQARRIWYSRILCSIMSMRFKHSIRHIPRLKDTLDSKTVKIEIKSQLSVFHFISFEYLQNELDKELLYKILIGSSIFSYFKVFFLKNIIFSHSFWIWFFYLFETKRNIILWKIYFVLLRFWLIFSFFYVTVKNQLRIICPWNICYIRKKHCYHKNETMIIANKILNMNFLIIIFSQIQ